MSFKRCIVLVLAALLAVPVGMASPARDDDDKDPSIQQGIRRLHPERERAKAIKLLQEQMSRKAEPKADPWDTSGEVWGEVDVVPVAVKDSAAVVGRRLDRGEIDDAGVRMTWRDEPVTVSIDQLLPYFTIEDGVCRSKYVSSDSVGNEVYFAFTIQDGDSLPGPLQLCVRYSGSSAFEYDQAVFTIDGYDYLFYPMDPRHGALDGGLYWASSDDELREAYRDLVYALAHGHWVMLKLQGGAGVSRVKVLTDGQRDDFANTLALYLLLGGQI